MFTIGGRTMGIQFFVLICIPSLIAGLMLWNLWRSEKPNRLRKLLILTLFLTFDLIVFGAFTRLTDSGLGCPDWPGCYAKATPIMAATEIFKAQDMTPNGPVTMTKAWIEMIHRYLAMTVGLLIIFILIMAFKQRFQDKHTYHNAWSLLLIVIAQGAFGAWTVTMKLKPIIVTLHLLFGLALLSALSWTWSSHKLQSHNKTNKYPILAAGLGILMIIISIQIALGGWVSTNYAALACSGFPHCNGNLLPNFDLENAFSLWRELGKTSTGTPLSVHALVSIQWVHRSFAWIALFSTITVVYLTRKHKHFRSLALYLLVLIFLQFVLGIGIIFLNWPLTIAVLHNAVAALLIVNLSVFNHSVRYVARD